MSEQIPEPEETTEPTDESGADEPEATEAPPAGWQGPTESEWREMQKTLGYFAKALEPPEEEPEPTDDPMELVDRRFQEYEPLIAQVVKEQGQKRMNSIFDHVKQTEKIDFDYKLAERSAQSFLNEGLDPVQATVAGAKYAAEVRKQERQAGRTEKQKSLQPKGGSADDFGVGEGVQARPPAKSYDEVINRWAADTEVG